MTFSYYIANRGAAPSRAITDLDRVRMRLGDVRTRDYLLEDEEISEILTLVASDIPQASLRSARLALARVAQDVDTNGAGMVVNRQQKTANLQQLITELERETLGATQLTLTGNSIAEEQSRRTDEDKKGPYFQVNMDKNPNSVGRSGFPPNTSGQ